MNNKKILKIGFICLIAAITAGSIFWYYYFSGTEKDVLAQNVRLELINNGRINYLDAVPNDLDEVIPTYYFRVKNNVDVPLSYNILINDVSPEIANDGCTNDVLFIRSQLDYELFKDNKLIKKGTLSDLNDDVLLSDSMEGKMTCDYAVRIRLNETAKQTLGRHYHYVINIVEIK